MLYTQQEKLQQEANHGFMGLAQSEAGSAVTEGREGRGTEVR